MGKTLGYGEITVANMTEPFTVMLTNEAQQFATDSNRKVTSAQSYYTDIIVIRGSQERTDYTIGNITSGSGITVSKSSKRVTFSVSAGTTIGADTGVIEIPITLDGQTVKKQFSWSCGKQGPQGVKGEDGSNFAWNLLKGTGTAKEFTPKGNLTNQTTLFNKLDLSGQTLKEGDKFVISCDLEWTQFTQGTSGTFDYRFQGSVDDSWSYDNIFTQGLQKVQPTKAEILASDGKKHLSAVCTMKQSLLDKKIFEIGIRFDNTDGTGKIKISNLKIAKEDKESPWCLHPDELKGATGDKGKSVQSVIEYYLATSASTGVTTSTSGWSTDPTTQKLTAEKKYLWNCKQTVYDDGTRGSITSPVICGTYGDKGQNAKNLSITPSSQYFKSTDGGKTFAPNAITIKPTIQGEISFGKWQYSIDGGVSFADVVSGQKGLTVSNNVLAVSKDSSLYSDAVTMVTFRAVANDSSFYDTCSIAKIYDVSDIGDGRNLLTGVSSYIKDTPFEKTDSRADGWTMYQNIITSIELEAGKKYVLQAKTDGNWAANHDINGQDPSKKLVTLWLCSDKTNNCFDMRQGYAVFTPTVTAKYKLRVNQYSNGTDAYTIHLWDIKLEKGSFPTGWTPAPEDLQTAILSTKSEISDVSLEVDNNKQAIEQRVEKTTYQQDLKLVKGDISKANEGLNKWRYEIYPKSLFASEYQGKSTMDVFAKNTNLTPSQSVLINDMDLSIAWNYDNNYIGYALTFAKFSAAKSVAITFAHDDGAHIYLNGKLIGGSDAYSQTGESLTLDFVKGWNCIEVVVNEGASTEGFKLGTTISAISECQLMNCYYGTPVARQSHITNQLVENTTNIEGVTTTMQKVMTTVGGSDRIDEFVNNYNKTIESEKQFKKTIGETYTTKDDFNGLEIGGRNLLLYSQTIRAHKDYYGVGWLTDEVETFNGCPVWSVKNQWGRLTWLFKSHVIDRGLVKVGDTLTYSLYAKTNNASGKSINCSYRFKGNTNAYWFNGSAFNVGTNWTRYSVTFTITKDMLATDTYMTEIGFEETASMSGDDKVYYACPKLERGTKATDYTPALEDNEINGQNLVSNLSSNWEQGSVSYVANSTYASIKTVLATRLRTEDVFSVSGNVTISAGTSTNSSKEELNFYYVLFDVNKKAIGVPASGSEWQSLTSPKIINCGDAKYMAIILRWGSGSTVITPSNISQICLKIERGTSATPFTLAPEDVNGKIVNVETIANQTAKEFSWIVKGGDSSSNFTLTDRVADLVAERINFNGLVTFSGTTNLIENSNMMNGLANITSECKAIKVIDDSTYRKALVITPIAGGRIFWGVANVWKANITYTVSFVAKSSVAGQKIKPSRSVADWGDEITLTTSYVKYTTRIKSTATADDGTLSFSFSNAIGDVTLTNVKLETGMNPTDWSPAPGDYITQASLVRNWTTNTTWIDGGKIYTGSITADKIATDAIKSRNYISSGGTQGSFLNLSDGSFKSPNLSWDSNGNLIAKNANIIGNLTAGTVGEWKIDKYIYSKDKVFFDINKHNGQSIYNKNSTNNLFLGDGKVSSFYWFTTQNNTFIIENGNSPQYATGPAGISFGTNIAQGQIELYESVFPGKIIPDYETTSHTSELSISGSKISFSYYDSNGSSFSDSPYTYIMADYARFYGDIFVQGSITTDEGVDVGGKLQASSIAAKNGGLIETSGTIYGGGEIQCGGGQMRIIGGDYGILLRNDGSDFYILSTDSGNQWGYWNSKRPFRINLANGIPYFEYGIIIPNENYLLGNGYQLGRGTSWGGVCLGDNSKQLRLYGTSIWASHSISTSDENLKENFTTLDQYEDFYMNLNPIGFNYIGDYDGKKTHFGFGAHKTEDILESEGYNSDKFAVVTRRPLVQEDIEKRFGKDVEVDIEMEYGVSYTEFIALNTHMIQKTRRELEQVKQEKADLETRLQAIEAKLGL